MGGWISDYSLWSEDNRLSAGSVWTDHRLPITDNRLSITDHQ